MHSDNGQVGYRMFLRVDGKPPARCGRNYRGSLRLVMSAGWKPPHVQVRYDADGQARWIERRGVRLTGSFTGGNIRTVVPHRAPDPTALERRIQELENGATS
jgi:hypothetical protein